MERRSTSNQREKIRLLLYFLDKYRQKMTDQIKEMQRRLALLDRDANYVKVVNDWR